MTTPTVKLVKMKSMDEIKKLIRAGKVTMMHCSDDGEFMRLGIVDGGMTHVIGTWTADIGEEWAVVDHPTTISKASYEAKKILFEE